MTANPIFGRLAHISRSSVTLPEDQKVNRCCHQMWLPPPARASTMSALESKPGRQAIASHGKRAGATREAPARAASGEPSTNRSPFTHRQIS